MTETISLWLKMSKSLDLTPSAPVPNGEIRRATPNRQAALEVGKSSFDYSDVSKVEQMESELRNYRKRNSVRFANVGRHH